MNRTEAQEFFRDHSEWLANSWGMSPEGRKYKCRFDRAVEAIMKPEAQLVPAVDAWESDCAALLRQPPGHGWQSPSPYVQAIKMTRNAFGCSLVDGKRRVDELRTKLCLVTANV